MTKTFFDRPTTRFDFTTGTLPTVIGGLLVWSGSLLLMML
jgi:hypothetical protein